MLDTTKQAKITTSMHLLWKVPAR